MTTSVQPGTARPSTPTLDPERIEAFLHKAVADCGAAFGVLSAAIGDRLGLYRAMKDAGPVTPSELAGLTGVKERYAREWLMNQAAGGYVDYDAASGRYTLPAEHAAALTESEAPYYCAAMFEIVSAIGRADERIGQDFREGRGMGWGEHDHRLFSATERMFRPGYAANLVEQWIPALEGVRAKLERGARVADIGCGHGASTILMAQAFPKSRFVGYDNHAPSIEEAREAARRAGVNDRAEFEVASATDFPGKDFDLIAFFDCFHDLADPEGAARHAHEALREDGTLMMVEPMAGEQVQDNLNPLGRFFTGASIFCCVPNSLAGRGPALGTVATEQALGDMVRAGGFTRFRRATETPFNRVFEARA